MTVQFGRFYRLVIDDILIDELDMSFRAVRTGTKEPNTLEMSIYNIGETRRNDLQKKEKVLVQLEAGYKENYGSIFLGDVRSISSTYKAPNWITEISSGDGESASQKKRINKSFAAGTDIATVMKEAAAALGDIGKGNLSKAILKGKLPNGAKEFVNGITLSGNAAREFDKVCKSAGLQWSIQEHKLQILQAAETIQSEAVVLTPDSGLIGSPTLSSDGVVMYTALLNPKIIPGRQILIESRHVKGYFKAERCIYSGDTSGNPWYVSGEAKQIK